MFFASVARRRLGRTAVRQGSRSMPPPRSVDSIRHLWQVLYKLNRQSNSPFVSFRTSPIQVCITFTLAPLHLLGIRLSIILEGEDYVQSCQSLWYGRFHRRKVLNSACMARNLSYKCTTANQIHVTKLHAVHTGPDRDCVKPLPAVGGSQEAGSTQLRPGD